MKTEFVNMTQISGPEVKYSLRKMDYPLCAKEALIKIGKYIINQWVFECLWQ